MPPPPLPEAFVDPAQEWGTEHNTWGSQGDHQQQQQQQQQQLSSQQVPGIHRS